MKLSFFKKSYFFVVLLSSSFIFAAQTEVQQEDPCITAFQPIVPALPSFGSPSDAQQKDLYIKELQELSPTYPSKPIKLREDFTYSINLMWINKKLNQEQRFIYPAKTDKTEEKFHAALINKLFEWATKNPESTVVFWYDSQLTSPNAVQNTKKIIAEQQTQNPSAAPIICKDIRLLPKVCGTDPFTFSEAVPVYFRADLLRLIATTETLTTENFDYFVYADMDIPTMTKEELFDTEAQKNLEKIGIVLARGGVYGYENCFHIATRHKPNLIKAINIALIDLGIARLENARKNTLTFDFLGRNKIPVEKCGQLVFNGYLTFFQYFYHLENLGVIPSLGDNKEDNDVINFLRPYSLRTEITEFKILDNSITAKPPSRYEFLIPTKEVHRSACSMNYD